MVYFLGVLCLGILNNTYKERRVTKRILAKRKEMKEWPSRACTETHIRKNESIIHQRGFLKA